MKAILLRALVLVVSTLFAVCLFEGVASLATGRSLLRSGGAVEHRLARTVDRDAAAELTEGPWALDVDPLVGMRMKAGVTRAFAGIPSTTDEHGQRVRLGPPPAPDAPRIVVLGDSVAYGFGVADDETYAHVLEELIEATGGVRPYVRTVACPGWNQRSSFRYLLDHLDRYDPDVVIYLPIKNDLDDGYVLNETGFRDDNLDPTRGAAHAPSTISAYYRFVVGVPKTNVLSPEAFLRAGGPDAFDRALVTGVTPESRRRWDELVRLHAELDAALRARDAQLVVANYTEDFFHRDVELHLRRALPDLPLVGLVHILPGEDTLPSDPHANAAAIRAGAIELARFLIAYWPERFGTALAGDEPLEEQARRYRDRVVTPWDEEKREAEYAKRMALREAAFEDRIALDGNVGLHQVYSGLQSDGTVGRHVWFALKNPGRARLTLRLRRLPPDASVWPLELRVQVNGLDIGALKVPHSSASEEDDALELRVSLPEVVQADGYWDVLISSSQWMTEQAKRGRRLASYRLLEARAND